MANQDRVPALESGEGSGGGRHGQVGGDAEGGRHQGVQGGEGEEQEHREVGTKGGEVEEQEEQEAGAKRLRHLLGSCAKRTRIREQAVVVTCLFDCGAHGLVRASDVNSDTLPYLCSQHACARCGGDVSVASDGVIVCRQCAPAPEEDLGELFRARWAPALMLLSCPGRVTLSATAGDAAIQSLFAGIQVLAFFLCVSIVSLCLGHQSTRSPFSASKLRGFKLSTLDPPSFFSTL